MTKQISNKFMKITFTFLLIIFFFMTSACSNDEIFNLENHIGLYELVDKKCDIVNGAFDPCDSTYFFEIVKGQFSGIKDSELAYVFWSGDPKIDPELQYTAQLIGDHSTIKLTNNKLWLNKNSNTQEYLSFSEGKLSRYFAKYTTGNNGVTRTIQYSLKPVLRANYSHFHFKYPRNK
ncbi:MAG: hypothetical protein L3J88_09640 [Gammaproteobacteria bacterium]|nr:hypothetical protein [Gammaproteobacteria bacterium]MCF6363585.1 hypothetical protein [Gammaproteobacteria bacterium]